MSARAAAAPAGEAPVRAGFIVFGFGLALYILVQVGLVLGPVLTRPVPPGTTDSYVYIAKAQQILTCFRQRCPALRDLRAQVEIPKGASAKTAKRRSLAYQRELYQYHLIHSVMLAGLKSAGLSWEAALNALSVAGAVLIALALAWLLYASFGAGPAGLALMILAFAVHPGFHGSHWVVPSNISFGIGLLAMAGIVARPRWIYWALPVAVLAMVWMHPAGRIYGLAALALFGALIVRRERRRWPVVAWGLVALVSPVIVGALVARPSLSFAGLEGIAGWGLIEGVGQNARAALWSIYPWLYERGGIAILCLSVFGLWLVEPGRAAGMRLLYALSAGMAVVSIFYLLPSYPAELFHRVWIFFAMIATGCASYALWAGTGRLRAYIADDVGDSAGDTARGFGRRYARFGRLVTLVLIGLVSLYIGLGSLVNGGQAVLAKARYMVIWGSMSFDASQPKQALSQLGRGERVAYLDELSFVFYASRGGFGHGAVFGPAVIDTKRAGEYFGAGGRVALAVRAIEEFYGLLPLRRERPIVIRSPRPIDWSRVRIKVRAPARPLRLRIRLEGAGVATARIEVAAGTSGWLALGLPKSSFSRAIAIVRGDGATLASIEGLRLSQPTKRTWPWDAGITILRWNVGADLAGALSSPAGPLKSAGKKNRKRFRYRFESAGLVPKGCRNLGIIADSGATVVSRVSCKKAP